MKYYILLSLLILIPFYPSFSEPEDDLFILMQTIVRNSDGALVTFLETTKYDKIDRDSLDSFLEFESDSGQSGTLIIDGQEYQVIRRQQTSNVASEVVIANTNLFDPRNNQTLLSFFHDGYNAIPGDNIQTFWTFLIPVN